MDISKKIYDTMQEKLTGMLKEQYQNSLGIYDKIDVVKDQYGTVSLSKDQDLKYLLYYNNFYVCNKIEGNSTILLVDKGVAKAFGASSKMSLYQRTSTGTVKFIGNYEVTATMNYISLYQKQIEYKDMQVYVRVGRY